MCGIVGYVGERSVLPVLISGLQKLEYRGYDSSGVAVFSDKAPGEKHQRVNIAKSEGKLQNVEKMLETLPWYKTPSHCGIGHTRWATHGKPTTTNAHPHQVGPVILVHNGIIENYQELKAEILKKGLKPKSETDSELFGFLVKANLDLGMSFVESVRQSFRKIEGACSVVVMSETETGTVIGVRNGSPLVVAKDPKGGVIFASDAQPILEYTNEVYFLENGDMAIGKADSFEILSLESGKAIQRSVTKLDWRLDQIDKKGFDHYMLKEIYEQPTALVDTFNQLMDRSEEKEFVLADQPGVKTLLGAKELIFVACGTSWHAALLGKLFIERYARIPVAVELASEFRYRDPVLNPGTVIVGVSQSGETADTLAVIREYKAKGIPTIGVSNVRGSTLSREAGAAFYTGAGPEIGVAATKTFLTQVLTFLCWSGAISTALNSAGATALDSAGATAGADSKARGNLKELFHEIVALPHSLMQLLDASTSKFSEKIKETAKQTQNAKGFFFIGRGFSYPLALEGALKLKEIAYVHAEGYAAGELKHGPIAMIDQEMVVVVLAPLDGWRDKTVSNLEEVKARGARIVSIGTEGDAALERISDYFIPIPKTRNESLLAFSLAAAVQLFSYEVAKLHGTDIDKPRNLAKSVTVE